MNFKKYISIAILAVVFLTFGAFAKNFSDNVLRIGDGITSTTTDIISNQPGNNDPFLRFDPAEALWKFSNDGSILKSLGSGSGGGGGINLLGENNPDFESGLTEWVSSGAAFSIETTAPLFGDGSGLWDASTAGQFLTSPLVALPSGILGRTCSVSFDYKWVNGVAGNVDVELLDQTAAVLHTIELQPSDISRPFNFFFSCSETAADSLQVRLASTADAQPILIDNVFLGTGKQRISTAFLLQESLTADLGSTNSSTNVTNFQNFVRKGDVDKLIGPYNADGTFNPLKTALFVIHCSGNSSSSTSGAAVRLNGVNVSTENATNSSFDSSASWSGIIGPGDALACTTTGAGMNVMQISLSATTADGTESKKIDLETSGALLTAQHEGDCSFSNTGNAFNSYTSDATCTFSVSRNIGFKNVSGGDTPVLNAEFPYKGDFYICAEIKKTINNITIYSRMTMDGSPLKENYMFSGSGVQRNTLAICNVIQISDTVTKTFEIETSTGSGTSTLASVSPANSNAIEWKILPLNQAMPSPVFTDIQDGLNTRVFSEPNTVAHSCYLDFTTTSLDIISGPSNCSWIESTTRLGTGRGVITPTADAFSGNVSCVAGYFVAENNATQQTASCNLDSTTSTNITVGCRATTSANGTGVDSGFTIICHGSK